MRTGIVVCFVMLANVLVAQAALTPVFQFEFSPSATVVGFETGSTGEPTVPGMTFLESGGNSGGYYGSSANFSGFNGTGQGWSNLVSTTYSDIGADFFPNVEAVGGLVGRIPNFTNEHPPFVTVELFNNALVSLGTANITLPAAFNSPVFFGFKADQPIRRFRMTGNDSGFFSVDNFTFGQVPEPSSMLAALAMCAMVMRRRRACRATV